MTHSSTPSRATLITTIPSEFRCHRRDTPGPASIMAGLLIYEVIAWIAGA